MSREWDVADGILAYLVMWAVIIFLAGATLGALVVWVL